MSYDGREDEIMQEEEVEQEDIDPREELEQQDPGDRRQLFKKVKVCRRLFWPKGCRSDQELDSKTFSQIKFIIY